jgi:hypothetical protein
MSIAHRFCVFWVEIGLWPIRASATSHNSACFGSSERSLAGLIYCQFILLAQLEFAEVYLLRMKVNRCANECKQEKDLEKNTAN